MDFFSLLLKIGGVFLIVLLNAFFVAAEFALVKVRGTQIEMLAQRGSRSARMGQHVLQHLDRYLSACQVGITMTSLGLGWVGEPFVATLIAPLVVAVGVDNVALLHTIAFAVAFSFITYIHIVLGEQAPKWYAIQFALRSTLLIAGPLQLFYNAFRPFIWLVNESSKLFLRALGIRTISEGDRGHSAEELRLLVSRGEAITALGKTISLRAMELRDRSIRQVMVPRTRVVYLSTEWSIEANIAAAIESQFTRYPLCERNLDNVIGMIHLKDLFRLKGEQGPGSRLLTIKREMLFLPESTTLEKTLNTFLAKRVLMAIAVDEYGGTAGLVTLENVLEELVGDIRDEFDVEQPPVQRISEGEFLVDGSMPLHDFAESFGVRPESGDVVTVSGYAIQLHGRMPERGATVAMGPWLARVEATERRRIKTLRLIKRET